MTGSPSSAVRKPLPLRRRLTREIMSAIVVLVLAFALTTLLAIGLHLDHDAQRDVHTLFSNLSRQNPRALTGLVQAYNRPSDPRIWVIKDQRVMDRSPNSPLQPPRAGLAGFIWQRPPVFQGQALRGGLTFVIDWPLASDLTLFRGLALVVAAVTALAAVAGVAIARWTTRRALEPVKTMTDGVQRMLDTRSIHPLPLPSGEDEFTKLAVLLNRLLASLEHQRQQERDLLADAAHHLRTPLGVIRGNLDILRRWHALDLSTRDECLETLDRTVTEMAQLARDLLTMEQASASVDISLSGLQLAVLLREVAEDASALAAAQPPLTVELTVEPSLSNIRVLAYEAFARRALWAVIENALKYCSPERGTVRLELCAAPNDPLLGVRVQDNGPGIPAEELPHVFTRFYRGAQARQSPGAGLGLALARALMQAQHGSIQIQADSRGTIVTLWFRIDHTGN